MPSSKRGSLFRSSKLHHIVDRSRNPPHEPFHLQYRALRLHRARHSTSGSRGDRKTSHPPGPETRESAARKLPCGKKLPRSFARSEDSLELRASGGLLPLDSAITENECGVCLKTPDPLAFGTMHPPVLAHVGKSLRGSSRGPPHRAINLC